MRLQLVKTIKVFLFFYKFGTKVMQNGTVPQNSGYLATLNIGGHWSTWRAQGDAGRQDGRRTGPSPGSAATGCAQLVSSRASNRPQHGPQPTGYIPVSPWASLAPLQGKVRKGSLGPFPTTYINKQQYMQPIP